MREGRLSDIDIWLIIYVGFALLMSFPSNLLRLQGVEIFSGPYTNGLFLGFILLAAINLVSSIQSPMAERQLLYVFCVFLVYIFTLGVLNGHDDPIANMRYFVLPVAVYVLLIGRRFPLYFYKSYGFWVIVFVTHVAFLAYYYSFLYGAVYPGIGVQSIAYAGIFFFANGHFILFGMVLTLVVLEGKRSILLSLLLTLVLLRLIHVQSRYRWIFAISAALFLAGLLAVGMSYISQTDSIPVFNRFNQLNPFSEDYDLAVGSSGRYDEIMSAFGSKTISSFIFGSGSGYTYEWLFSYSSQQEGEVKGYLHMSPANYVMVGGILGLMVFTYLCSMPFKAHRLPLDLNGRRIAFGFGLFSVFQSFFGFNLAVDAVSLIFIVGPASLAVAMCRGRERLTAKDPQPNPVP